MTKVLISFQDKFKSLLKPNTPKQTIYGTGNKRSKPKIQKQSKK